MTTPVSTKVIEYSALATAVAAADDSAYIANAAAAAANAAAEDASAYPAANIPQAALEPGGLQPLINRAGRGTMVGVSGDTTLPLNGQIIITEDVDLIGTQGVRYFDPSQPGSVGAGGSILRGAPGLPHLIAVRGRPQFIPEYDINVDVGAFGISRVELVGGYAENGQHTGAIEGIVFPATAGPMRPIVVDRLTARGFLSALHVIPRIIGPLTTPNGSIATYHTALNNVQVTNSVLTGNKYSLLVDGISSVNSLDFRNNIIERGGSVLFGDTAAAGTIDFINNLAELNHNTFRLGAGTHGAFFNFQGNFFEANTGYLFKILGDPNWRSRLHISRSSLNFVETHNWMELTRIRAEIIEPTLEVRVDRVQLLRGSEYKGLAPLLELDPIWTYVLSSPVDAIGQPDRNEYLGANGVFGSAAPTPVWTPLGQHAAYEGAIQPFDVGTTPAGGLLKITTLVRSRIDQPVMTGLLVANGGGGYVPVNQDLRIRVLPQWQLLTVIVKPGQIMYGGQFRLTSPDVQYTSIHVGVQGSDKLFRPYYPSA